MTEPLNRVVKAMFSDIDTDDAEAVLKKLALPMTYSDKAVATINAAANKLFDKAAGLKHDEAPRAQRKAVRDEINRFINARAFLYRLRPAQPGDTSVEVGPAGGNG